MLLLAIVAHVALAQQPNSSQSQQVTTITDAESVTVTRDADGTTINIRRTHGRDYNFTTSSTDTIASDWDLNLPFIGAKGRTLRKRWEAQCMHMMYVGGTMPGTHSAGIGGGWEFGIPSVIGLGWRPWRGSTQVSIGAGFAYRRMSLSGDYAFAYDRGNLMVVPSPDHRYTGSIHSWSLTVPLVIKQNIYKSFGVSVGAIASLNTYTNASQKYAEPDGVEVETRFKGLHQRPLTVDIIGAIGLDEAVGVYVKYSPMGAFRSGHGPQFRTFSVGAILNF